MIKNIMPSTLFVLMCLPCMAQSPELEQKIEELDWYIRQAKEQWEVPGLAVSIVSDGETLLLKGYGVRKYDQLEPVDTNTLFAICSTTKAMTAAAMAMLVDAGRLKWDDPVMEHLPEFQLHDPYITRSIRIRDLFTHNTGIGNADLLWYLWNYDPDEILYKMRFLESSYPLRGGYTYQNIMYAAAGKIIERISGMSWEDFIQVRIFDPLGMSHTYSNQMSSKHYENRSTPHHQLKGTIQAIPDGSADLIAPAGAVWSNIADMSKWMHFVLDSAQINGEKLISNENYQEWLKPQTIVSDQGFYPTQKLTKPKWKTYSLGWFQHDYQGRAVHFHTGSLQGTVAIIGLIPEEKLGVYVFGNLDHAEVRHAIMYKVFDVFGDRNPERDWSAEFKELYSKKPAASKQDVKETPPPMSLDSYVGRYEDPYLGLIEVVQENDQLIAKIGADEKIQLQPKYLNTFSGIFISRPWMEDSTFRFEDLGLGPESLYFFGRKFMKSKIDE